MLVDTHAHLYLNKFDDDRDEVLQRAQEHDVQKIYLPNIDHTSIDFLLSWEQQYRATGGTVDLELHTIDEERMCGKGY